MTVGGWFDAEDLYGTFKTYQAVEKQNPGIFNVLVVGPWVHGGWARATATAWATSTFGSKTSRFYQKEIELPVLQPLPEGQGAATAARGLCLRDRREPLAEVRHWPPRGVQQKRLYLHAGGKLTFEPPAEPRPGAPTNSSAIPPSRCRSPRQSPSA